MFLRSYITLAAAVAIVASGCTGPGASPTATASPTAVINATIQPTGTPPLGTPPAIVTPSAPPPPSPSPSASPPVATITWEVSVNWPFGEPVCRTEDGSPSECDFDRPFPQEVAPFIVLTTDAPAGLGSSALLATLAGPYGAPVTADAHLPLLFFYFVGPPGAMDNTFIELFVLGAGGAGGTDFQYPIGFESPRTGGLNAPPIACVTDDGSAALVGGFVAPSENISVFARVEVEPPAGADRAEVTADTGEYHPSRALEDPRLDGLPQARIHPSVAYIYEITPEEFLEIVALTLQGGVYSREECRFR